MELHANLSKEELDFIVELGINILLAKGAFPFVNGNKEDLHMQISPSTDTTQ